MRISASLLGLIVAVWAVSASAIENESRTLQLHGFYEFQLRGIARDFDPKDNWDVTQAAHVLNLELEAEFAPDGFAIFDYVGFFTRVELRYDCVWTRVCSIFPGANAFGNKARKLPQRLNDGRRAGFVGNLFVNDTRGFRGEEVPFFRLPYRNRPEPSRRPYGIDRTEAFYVNFKSPGPDQILGTADDPAPFVFDRYFGGGNCLFSSRFTEGFTNGVGLQRLGPIDPACDVVTNAAFIDKPNPFREGDINPLDGTPGSLSLPYRPAPVVSWRDDKIPAHVARGLWVPNARLAELLEQREFDDPALNFSQNELAWNHGWSQRDEGPLREFYFDLEMFDSRLWLRIGKQAIVWGKTELFRAQDQFNPLDLALSTLPTLEEARIPLWAIRGIWSFFTVGPIEDLRLELALNIDQVEANDLGRCGEPYTVVLVCAASFGFLSHGFEGVGIAGVQRPPAAWESWKGVEVGARVEFRWDRFSFSISDFYGYEDLPHLEKIFTFERNVDPVTGRPRRLNSRGGCETGKEPDCLQGGRDALLYHSVNQTMYAKNCAATVGFVGLDPEACGPSLFNSQVRTDPNPLAPRLMIAITNVFSGQCPEGPAGTFGAGCAVFSGLGGFTDNTFAELDRFPWINRTALTGTAVSPLVPLFKDPFDGAADLREPEFPDDLSMLVFLDTGIAPFLTDQQEALLGCGPFYGTKCDIHGIDLLNAEASAIAMSFAGFEGTFFDLDTTDRGTHQPGTAGFRGGPSCTRYEGGRLYVLPGCRGPGDSGYRVEVDGSTGGAVHPFTGQEFKSEMAIVSWNYMMLLVGTSLPADLDNPEIDEFDADDSFRSGACSFRNPQYCNAFSDFLIPLRSKRNDIRAGGNGRFGRRDFQWHDGTPVVLRYQKRNVLGGSMDFAEDTTKSNWSIEATWVAGIPLADQDEFSGLRDVDTYNLVISADRPTFINFLNANRTFFFNFQAFFQYVSGFQDSFTSTGPFNMLMTLTANTGYFQDRLLPSTSVVYDVGSGSGAFLGQVTYRWTENFSGTVGMGVFWGGFDRVDAPVNPIASLNRVGHGAYNDYVENGLSPIRNRDELFLRLRYTF